MFAAVRLLKKINQNNFRNQVGADGANSMVRKQMGVNNFSLSYNQMGLIATVELNEECEENFVAWQRFLPNGVIALLPLSNKLSSIVWSTESKHFKHLMQLSDAEFIDAVNNAFVRILIYISDSQVSTLSTNHLTL